MANLPKRDWNLDLPVLGSLAQHETSALANYATEDILTKCRGNFPVNEDEFKILTTSGVMKNPSDNAKCLSDCVLKNTGIVFCHSTTSPFLLSVNLDRQCAISSDSSLGSQNLKNGEFNGLRAKMYLDMILKIKMGSIDKDLVARCLDCGKQIGSESCDKSYAIWKCIAGVLTIVYVAGTLCVHTHKQLIYDIPQAPWTSRDQCQTNKLKASLRQYRMRDDGAGQDTQGYQPAEVR
ncbi:unnamed protein product [Timema podura]|uniref:Uncharacterized protein n=1 Tax=Timema podura TaxID=61482 RepID=A0ABN7NLS0_TIMPD|nr:unnamed protein product [Timema podura]